MKLHILIILLLLLLSRYPFPLLGQTEGRGRYADIDLYYQWQEHELRDSIYRKVLQQHVAGLPELTFATDSVDEDIESLLSMADHAAKKKDMTLELEALGKAFTKAFWQANDYDQAFYIGFRLEERITQVSDNDFPYRRKLYYKLGEAYYLMLDFHKSILLLENALSPAPVGFCDHTNLDALIIMGICYANIGQMDTSDSLFRATLKSGDIVHNRPLYNAYALAHLGCNAMLAGQYEKALAISDVAWPVLRHGTNDYSHLAGMCYCLGRSHLEKGDFGQASVWIDSLVYFAHHDQYNQVKRIKQAHLLRTDYYMAMGDADRTKLYNDSLINIFKQEEENVTSGYITRALQRYNEEKILEHETNHKRIRMRLAAISAAALFFLATAAVIFSLYRKKNAAYRKLAQQAHEWAISQNRGKTANLLPKEPPTEDELRIIALADREMEENHSYRDASLTLDDLADRLGIHRNIFSAVINKATNGNFKQYINGYRIREAIRILSQNDRKKLYIDEIYERVGFNNRSSFYRVFKQFTGLSPLGYQKNKESTPLGFNF